MSDTPQTDAVKITRIDVTARECGHLYVNGGMVPIEHARTLEKERDYLRDANKRLNRRLTKAEGIIEAAGIVDGRQTKGGGGLGRALANYAANKYKRELAEAQAQAFEALGCLSTIAEDCDAWLNNQCDETACEFIKAVRDYATAIVKDDLDWKLKRLWQRGSKAWRDVKDASAWVDELRGNTDEKL